VGLVVSYTGSGPVNVFADPSLAKVSAFFIATVRVVNFILSYTLCKI
jgi:hypothetical protein